MISWRRFGTAVVVVAVVVDGVLIAAALRTPTPPTDVASVVTRLPPPPAAGEQGSPDASAVVDPSASPSASPSAARSPTASLLAVASASAALRAERLPCARAGDARLQLTTDGGSTWRDVAAPVPHLLRLSLDSAISGWLIGAGADCAPTFYRTGDGGATWVASATLGQTWFITSSGLRAPSGANVAPCSSGIPTALGATSTTEAVVLCGHAVRRTVNGGTSWSAVSTPTGDVLALDAPSASTVYVVQAGGHGCAGLSVKRSRDGGQHWSTRGCLTGAAPADAVTLAMTASGAGMVRDVDRTLVTSDSGATWIAR